MYGKIQYFVENCDMNNYSAPVTEVTLSIFLIRFPSNIKVKNNHALYNISACPENRAYSINRGDFVIWLDSRGYNEQ
jgi:hypothetical protein